METTISTPRDVAFPAPDGLTLRGRYWAQPAPRAVLVILHGFGEHGGCYQHVAAALGPAIDFDVFAPDLRGHGRSDGRRGVVRQYGELMADARAALQWARHAHPDLPRFLLGHSNGGQLALRIALEGGDGLAGLIVSNPVVKVATKVPALKIAVGKLLLRWAPGVTLDASVPPEQMTHDLAIQQEHRIDPLRHNRISAPYYFGMRDGGDLLLDRAGAITDPILVLLSGADPLIDPGATRAVFERLGSTDKTLLFYPKMLHEPLNELGRARVFDDLIAWLDPRAPQSA